ncbi:MAG: IS1595 family transposase [Spirochaetia bacterium]|nr:IS1595 family transposase [Spirochaetia bacterium]
MLGKTPTGIYKKYFGIREFIKAFPDEKACEKRVLELKYPNGFYCSFCHHTTFYRLNGPGFKRSRLLQCQKCKKQVSLTANTVFHGTKVSLHQWFLAIFFVTQTKKGISGWQLSKQIGVCEATARLMLYKLRREMEEKSIEYQIGGLDKIIEMDEFEVGGVNAPKQNSLILLEKQRNGRLGRVRFAVLKDETVKSLELLAIPQIAAGSTIHSDGKKTYKKIVEKYLHRLEIKQVAHWEESHSHAFLNDLNTIVGNFKTWYRGIHHSFALRNTAYYMNEFAYRFNRRRSEINIFERLLNRSITRARILKRSVLFSEPQYQPLAA